MAELIVEDGTGTNPNANSYVDLDYAREFAESMNLTLSDDDDIAIQNLLGAMPYIESRPYQGQRATAAQPLSWPRRLVSADGYPVPENVVPVGIKRAQVVASAMVFGGVDLLPTVSAGGVVTKEKVGPIETEYSEKYSNTWNGQNVFTAVDVYLLPFMNFYSGYRLSPSFGF